MKTMTIPQFIKSIKKALSYKYTTGPEQRLARFAATIRDGWVTNGSVLFKAPPSFTEKLLAKLPPPTTPLQISSLLADYQERDRSVTFGSERQVNFPGDRVETVLEVFENNIKQPYFVNRDYAALIGRFNPGCMVYSVYPGAQSASPNAIYWFKDRQCVAVLSKIVIDTGEQE